MAKKAQAKSKTKPKRSENKKPRKGKASSFMHYFKMIVTPSSGKEFEAVCSLQADVEDYADARAAFANRLAGGLIVSYKLPLKGAKEDAPMLVLNAMNASSIEIDVASDDEVEWLSEAEED